MPWKLYQDSRKRVPGARGDSDTDFAVQLARPIVVSGKAFLDVVLCPNSFYLVRAGPAQKPAALRLSTVAAGKQPTCCNTMRKSLKMPLFCLYPLAYRIQTDLSVKLHCWALRGRWPNLSGRGPRTVSMSG